MGGDMTPQNGKCDQGKRKRWKGEWESTTIKKPRKGVSQVEIVVAQLVKELKPKKTKKWVEE